MKLRQKWMRAVLLLLLLFVLTPGAAKVQAEEATPGPDATLTVYSEEHPGGVTYGVTLSNESTDWQSYIDSESTATLRLNRDVTGGIMCSLYDTNLTLDMNGHAVTGENNRSGLYVFGSDMKLKLMDSVGGGSITRVSISDEFIDECTVEVENGIYKGAFDLEGDCNVTINGGTFMKSGLEGRGTECVFVKKGMLTINGGTFSGNHGYAVIVEASGKLNITGGEFGGSLIYDKGDSSENGIQLSGGSFYVPIPSCASISVKEVGEQGKNALLAMLAPGYTYGGNSIYLECFSDGCSIMHWGDSPIVIVPGTPSLPAEREGNKNPDTPGTSDTPGISSTPGTSDTPGISDTSGTSDTPGVSDTPDTSVTPGTSVTPETSGASDPSKETPKLSKKKLTLTVGKKATLKVTGTSETVTWKSSNKKVAAVQNGKVTAKKKGTAKIIATVGGKKLTCKVTVKAKASTNTGGSASKDSPKLSRTKLTLKVGKKATLKVTNAQGKVTWKSSNKKVAAVKNGKVTAKKKGTAKITATVGGKKLTCKVTVKEKAGVSANMTKYESLGWNPSGRTYYEVGSDIPAGDYVIFVEAGKKYGFYVLQNDPNDFESVVGGNLYGNTYVRIKAGEYLRMSDCYAVPASEAEVKTTGQGVFKVGTDIEAGTYKLKKTGSRPEYCIFDGIGDLAADQDLYELANGYGSFAKTTMVTVKKGQYLFLRNCKIAK